MIRVCIVIPTGPTAIATGEIRHISAVIIAAGVIERTDFFMKLSCA